jgi:apolipoprotein N-acyltransferase
VLAVLSTAHKLGLGLSGVAFIAFALVSAMLVPRSNPDFPGRRLGWYVFVTILFFAAMMCAVVFFGKEKKTPEHREAAVTVLQANVSS